MKFNLKLFVIFLILYINPIVALFYLFWFSTLSNYLVVNGIFNIITPILYVVLFFPLIILITSFLSYYTMKLHNAVKKTIFWIIFAVFYTLLVVLSFFTILPLGAI